MSVSGTSKVPVKIRNSSGDIVRGDLRYRVTTTTQPLVIICHSFMAFKEWGFFPYVSEKIAEEGFATLTFNFSRNGVVEDNDRITEFGKFESNTISSEVNDLQCMIDAVWAGEVGRGIVNPQKTVLLGHSRGGGVAIVQASKEERIEALVTWSAVSTFDRWTTHQKGTWRSLGYLPLSRDTSVSPLRLGLGLLEDLEQHYEAVDILQAAAKIHVPWLILQGAADLTVPQKEAQLLWSHSNKTVSELVLLDSVNHLYHGASFNEDHYFTLNRVIGITTRWLHQKLS